ncbi:MAG: hypothetical protein LBF75_01085 [Treponema sp.]|jgi:hypothetical protein|nr:hypothetical protein [Treponema sp.]
MDAQTLETKRLDIAQQIESLPGTFEVFGTTFSWEESRDCLRIVGNHPITYKLRKNGDIATYAFPSANGNGNQDALETIRYYQTCTTLLSDGFRQSVIADYQLKKPQLDSLIDAYQQIEQRMQVL